MPQFDRSTLLHMLTYDRPAGSSTESAFITRFIAPLPGATRDAFGNWHVIIGASPILWSCHTDTVHWAECRQTTHLDPVTDVVRLSRRSRRTLGSCLGADDTAGVFLCHQMILAGVPGHYIFHYGEERGGIGSSALARNNPELLAGAQFAIALDRRGTGDIITHQGSRCCSQSFVDSLAAQLNIGGLQYSAAPGVYTDTAEYTDIIGECTNLSVGYEHAHSERETLSLRHLQRLFDMLCVLDADKLVAERTPGQVDPADTAWLDYTYTSWKDWTQPACAVPRYQGKFSRLWERYTDPVAIVETVDGSIIAECQWCGSEFDPLESTAIDTLRFCCDYCERSWARPTSGYLDPAYQDVRLALAKDVHR